MGKTPCCDKANVKKGPWSPEEDYILKEYIGKHGTGGNWITLPKKAGLERCGKSCRLRWLNYLRPNIKHGEFEEEEDNIICSLYISIGSRWSVIAAQLPGRTDNDIKNYWNTRLKKKLLRKCQDHQVYPLAAAKQESKDIQSYATSETCTSPNMYGLQQQHGGVNHHLNTNMNGPYPNHGPGIISQLFEKNSRSTITESSSSSEPATFRLNPQQVQLDQEVFDHHSCLTKLLQRPEGILIDYPSKKKMTMISTSSQIQASNCINASHIQHSVDHNQYKLDAARQDSSEISTTPVLMQARKTENYIKVENPFEAQKNNSLFSYASSSHEGYNYESTWMNMFNIENNNMA